MATGAPAGGFDVAVALEGDLARFAHAEEVRLVVKGTEMVRAMEPTLVTILVTIEAVAIHHQRAGRNKITRSGSRHGWQKILLSLDGADLILLRMCRMEEDHADDGNANCGTPTKACLPLDARSRQPVQDVKPGRQQGRDDVRPIRQRTQPRIFQPQILELKDIDARQE